ncbi:unnamed protein product [Tetraodon nigroviridis]|uniref:(spotted green pufferfish) hypothetical protein n=1 Tax=Tetraodon nigroviridis TaxID=99883 RepID=Q4SQB8_TETNG|nr:unnamed protein product [Tetraodon nigroviridis]
MASLAADGGGGRGRDPRKRETAEGQPPQQNQPMSWLSEVSGYSQSAHASWSKGGIIPLLGINGELAGQTSELKSGHQTRLRGNI